jgi:hypothetical protein
MIAPPPPPGPPASGDPQWPGPAGWYEPSPPAYPASVQPGSGGWPPPAAAAPSLGERLGARLRRRPEPRFGIALAGAGAALLLFGAFVWAIGYYAEDFGVTFDEEGFASTGGGDRRFLGFVLFLGAAVFGYLTAIVRRDGPLATAGAVAAAFGVPLALAFLTLDVGAVFRGADPFDVDAVLPLSVVVWALSYFVVPGTRGRAVFLAAAAIGVYSYLGLKAAGGDAVRSAAPAFGAGGGSDTGSLTAVGLIFGLAYYGIAALLDRRGRAGAAVALVVAGFSATVAGIIASGPDFGRAGVGVLLIVVGLVLAWYGARSGRRFTTWTWSLGIVIGLGLIVSRIFPDNYTGAGVTLIIVGLLVVGAAYMIATATKEAPEIEEASPVPVS